MTMIDTSAWIEFLRATGSRTHLALRELMERDEPLHTTDVVVMEVLAGARDGAHEHRLRRLLGRCSYVASDGLATYEEAAALYRRCRKAGGTIRSLTDCLIGAVSLRDSIPVLHNDRDFEVLARHAGLTVV